MSNPQFTRPRHGMVGRTTCANICTEQGISFQPLSDIRLLIKRNKVLQRVKKVEILDRQRFGVSEPSATA